MKRRYYHPRRDARTGFSIFIIVIILAVAAGYAGTKYIIFPYLLGNSPAENSQDQSGKDQAATDSAVDVVPNTPSVIIDEQNVKKDDGNNGSTDVIPGVAGPFCVQFGSFSTKDGADTLSSQLSGKGIYSYVFETGGNYKVLGLPYATKEKAREAASVVSAVVSDVFVVDLANIIP